MADVFISFIHEEAEWAEGVQRFISMVLDFSSVPFLSSDQSQVLAGDKWLDRIMDELKDTKVVLLMMSKESVKRPWVNFEAGAAWTREKIIIPICFGGLDKGNLPKPYSSIQAIDLDLKDDHEYLARSIAHHLGRPDPMRRMSSEIAFKVGGQELKKKAERQEMVYRIFESGLEMLKRPKH